MNSDILPVRPTLSAIVPAYNVESYLGDALDSLFAQTVPFDEVIVIDDGSSDGTAEVMRRYAGRPGIKLQFLQNGGVGRARNAGVAAASSDYLYFIDSDDRLKPGFVAAMQAMLAERPALDLVYFSGESFLHPGFASEFLPVYRRRIERTFTSGIEATGVLLKEGTFFATPCLYLSRRELWRAHQLTFLPILHEDEEISTRLSCAAGATACIDTILYERRIRPESIMTVEKTRRHTDGYLHTLDSLARQCRQQRSQLAPIEPQLVRRFYTLLAGYVTISRKIGVRPRYRQLLGMMLTLGHLPGAVQLYEMSILPRVAGRLSRLARRAH